MLQAITYVHVMRGNTDRCAVGNDESSPMSWKARCRTPPTAAPFQHAWDE